MKTTKERKQQVSDFVVSHKSEIENIIRWSGKIKVSKAADRVKPFIDRVVRPQLGYNKNTNWLTIWFSLRRSYKKLFP